MQYTTEPDVKYNLLYFNKLIECLIEYLEDDLPIIDYMDKNNIDRLNKYLMNV